MVRTAKTLTAVTLAAWLCLLGAVAFAQEDPAPVEPPAKADATPADADPAQAAPAVAAPADSAPSQAAPQENLSQTESRLAERYDRLEMLAGRLAELSGS